MRHPLPAPPVQFIFGSGIIIVPPPPQPDTPTAVAPVDGTIKGGRLVSIVPQGNCKADDGPDARFATTAAMARLIVAPSSWPHTKTLFVPLTEEFLALVKTVME